MFHLQVSPIRLSKLLPCMEVEFISMDINVVITHLCLQTSASLKFTVLNPKGRIWTMVAGGGASVIYADTVSALYCMLQSTYHSL